MKKTEIVRKKKKDITDTILIYIPMSRTLSEVRNAE